jgi:uncharacterized protein YggE
MNTKLIKAATAVACMAFSTLMCFGTVIVSGVGLVTVKPDSFAIEFETRSTGESVVEALNKSSVKHREILDKLIPMDANVVVRVRSERIEDSNHYGSREDPTFTCARTCTVEMRIGNVTPETVISALSETKAAFGRSYTGFVVTYGLRDYSEALAAALDKAIADADVKARIIAKEANVTLGVIKGVECLDGSSPCGGYSDSDATGDFRYSGQSPDALTVRTVKRVTFE